MAREIRQQTQMSLRSSSTQANSHFSTSCSNESPPKSLQNLDDCEDDPYKDLEYEDFLGFLPIKISTLKIHKVTWDHFPAIPSERSVWKAHCFWTVGYTYDINMRKMKKSNNIRYRLQINAWCILSSKSWVKQKWDRLLEHETGHYLIGCLCALEFKKRADKFKYTKNYRIECTKIFQETFNEYIQMERRYDEETSHSQNIPIQKEWNKFIKENLLMYK